MPALIGYYLGLFSCFPFIGLPLGIAALILGYQGLRNFKQHPERKGQIHAWIALVAGLMGLLINLLILVPVIVALSKAGARQTP